MWNVDNTGTFKNVIQKKYFVDYFCFEMHEFMTVLCVVLRSEGRDSAVFAGIWLNYLRIFFF